MPPPLPELFKDYLKPEDMLGQDGLPHRLVEALIECAFQGE